MCRSVELSIHTRVAIESDKSRRRKQVGRIVPTGRVGAAASSVVLAGPLALRLGQSSARHGSGCWRRPHEQEPGDPCGPTGKEFVWFAFPGDFQHSEGNGPFQHRGQRQAQPKPIVGTWRGGSGSVPALAFRPSGRGVSRPMRGLAPRSHSLLGLPGWGCGQGGRWGRPGHSRTSRPAPSQTKPQSRRASSRRTGDQAWRAPSAQPGAKPTLSEATAPDPAVAS